MSTTTIERPDVPTFTNVLQIIEKIDHLRHALVQEALDRAGHESITSVQAYLVSRLEDDDRIAAGDLRKRGLYLGSNPSYNLSKLIDWGYLKNNKDKDDKRVSRISITTAGKDIRRIVHSVERPLLDKMLKIAGDTPHIGNLYKDLRSIERFLAHEVSYSMEG